MYNSYRSGTDAAVYAEGLANAVEKVEAAANEACDSIEYLEGELEDRDTEITDLETDLDEVRAELKKAKEIIPGEALLRVLRNVHNYVLNELQIAEKLYEGQTGDSSDGDNGDAFSEIVGTEISKEDIASGEPSRPVA